MKDSDFLSDNKYLFLPTKRKPKVALVVNNPSLAENAFKLYNPFSKKAKLLKILMRLAFIYFNGITKTILRVEKHKKSALVCYLEKELNKSLVTSLYFATANDKVVLQLQSVEGEIVGYLKYPVNEIGLQHLENEKNAIELLSDKKIVQSCLLQGDFDGTPFILLSPLEGNIGLIERQSLDNLVLKFRKKGVFLLRNHPRIKALEQSLKSVNLLEYVQALGNVTKKSIAEYACVYEHGDFAPWNIVNVKGQLIPFDFEFFVSDGLEHLDMIKYYFQVGSLLQNKTGKELIHFIHSNVLIADFFSLVTIFLIKEIYNKEVHNESYEFEVDLLNGLDSQ
jgi:hypothetical protein